MVAGPCLHVVGSFALVFPVFFSNFKTSRLLLCKPDALAAKAVPAFP
jgi:hypothetical protein